MVNIDQAIDRFLDHRRASGRTRGTLRLYARQLHLWRDWRLENEDGDDLAAVDIEELRAFFAYLRDAHIAYGSAQATRKPSTRPLSENTLASYHRTLRAFWSFLTDEGVLIADQQRFFHRLPAPAVPEDPRPSVDAPTIRRLIAACGDGASEESARNRAIVALLFETGMRISELCNLVDEVVDLPKRRARILRAKGNKHRMVFWQPSGVAHLARYLLMRRGKRGGPLFRGCSSRNNGGPVTPDLVRSTLKRIAADAGIRLPKGAPLHAIRHGFAHAAIEAGAQLTDLADLLGHADLETTRIYLRNDDDRLAAAYERIFSRTTLARKAQQEKESRG